MNIELRHLRYFVELALSVARDGLKALRHTPPMLAGRGAARPTVIAGAGTAWGVAQACGSSIQKLLTGRKRRRAVTISYRGRSRLASHISEDRPDLEGAMPLNPLRPPGKPRPLPTRQHKYTGLAEKKSGWDKASVIVQSIGGLAIFVSLAALFIGVRQFNEQQETNATNLVNQQHQATLNTYLDDMSDLVLNHKLSTAGPDSPITAIAIARTATALRNLDGPSKGILVRFLWEAGLILRPSPILDLYQVDLGGAVLQNADLYQAYLSTLNLTSANFNGAHLEGAYLSKSVLIQSSLDQADMACWSGNVCTNLSGAYLMRADLTDADLSGAILTGADLDGADLSGAMLAGANLHDALYNTRPIKVTNAQGELVTDMPTRWPTGFNPEAAGATCDDC